MSQTIIYKGVMVEAVERQGGRIKIRTKHPADAQKAAIPFASLEDGIALFETWALESELVAVDP